MKKNLILLSVIFLSLTSFAQVKTMDDGFSAKVRDMEVKVQFYTPDIVRVFKTTPNSNLEQKKDFVVELTPQHPEIIVSD